MKRRFLNKKGFTITEVLIAVAILALFVSMAMVGTSGLFGTGEKMMAVSKAAVLGSDVMQIITNEIRYGEEISVESDGETLKFNSATYGRNCSMNCKDGKLNVTRKNTAGEDVFIQPLGSLAYDEVKIKSLTFKEEDNGVIEVSLNIVSDTNTLWNNTVKIAPLYQKI